MSKVLRNIDIRKFAGIRTLIGIDLTDSRARIVQLERKGNLFNKFKPTFNVLKFLSCEFEEGSSLEERADNLRALLANNKLETKLAVSTIESPAIRVKTVAVPIDSNIDEWIEEHLQKILNVPLSIDQLIYRYEIV